MLIGGLYLVSFLTGVYVVWHLGKRAYYDEERLIDLALFSTVSGISMARISFLLSPIGRGELSHIVSSYDFGLSLLTLLHVNNGSIWWIGGLAFIATTLFLIYRWKWPVWPVGGFMLWGSSVAITLLEVLFWNIRGFSSQGILVVASSLICLFLTYVFMFNGNVHVRDAVQGIKSGYAQRKTKTQRPKVQA